MHNVKPAPEVQSKVYLLHSATYSVVDQTRTVYDSVEDFCRAVPFSWLKEHVAARYGDPIKIVTQRATGFHRIKGTNKFGYYSPEKYILVQAAYIVRTDNGEKHTAETLEEIYRELRRQECLAKYKRHQKRNNYCYGIWRSPKTANELRSAWCNVEEGEPPIKARRNYNNIVTAWDDTTCSADKSWKSQSRRRHQYRPR